MKRKSIGLVVILFMLLTVLPAFAPQKAAAASPYADGEYTVPFSVLKDTGSEPSATAEYVVSPAKLIVQNGKMHVVMTLNNSSWWQYFKVNSADVQVLSEDTVNDKRVVKFEVKDVDQLVSAKIHVIVTGIPGFSYDNKYDIRFKFNSKSIPLAPVVEKPTATPTPTPKPTVKPSESDKAATTPSQKPADTKEEIKQEPVTKVEEKPVQTKEEVVSKAVEEPVVEKEEEEEAPTEPVEPPNDKVEASEGSEQDTKEQEEVVKTVEESAAEEVKAESTSNSTPMMVIIILAIAILVGTVLLFKKKRK